VIFISTPDEALSKMHFSNDAFISFDNFAEKSKPVHLITFKKFSFQAYFFHSAEGLMPSFLLALLIHLSAYVFKIYDKKHGESKTCDRDNNRL
jgi:hypothetical protein